MTGERLIVIGVDPGVTTGLVRVGWPRTDAPPRVVQCDPATAKELVVRWLSERTTARTILAVEQFVVNNRAAHSATAPGRVTRDLIAELRMAAEGTNVEVVTRTAAAVKPWATDARLAKAKLLPREMRHARDACRHALFAACHDAAIPDPLSRRGR